MTAYGLAHLRPPTRRSCGCAPTTSRVTWSSSRGAARTTTRPRWPPRCASRA